MTKNIISTFLLCLTTFFAFAQDSFVVGLQSNDTIGRRFMISPMGAQEGMTSFTPQGGLLKAEVATHPAGFYNFVSTKGYSQIILPLYLPKEESTPSELNFHPEGGFSFSGSLDNNALAAYSHFYVENNRALWNLSGNNSENLKHMLGTFLTKADSIGKAYPCSPSVREYLSIWAYISAFDSYSSLPRILRIKPEELTFTREELLPAPHQVLDSPLAALFANTPGIVFASLPNPNNLDSALIYLDTHYTNKELKQKVKNDIAQRYVTRFNYEQGYEKGLARLQAATEKYGLDKQYVEEFVKRKATIPGQPFPENVVLKDTLGNVVDFSAFRGKYVYIDLWASWCIPCLKEVPVLQKLERELQNDKLVFLSISIDAKEDAWKKKMKQKNMHGNQFWNPGNTIGQALNVKGIPFFIIYDPDGKLYMHGAPRPSQGAGVVELLKNLGK